MRVLVTGAAGLYGVHLVDQLVNNPKIEEVFGVDNFSRNFLTTKSFNGFDSKENRFKLLKGTHNATTITLKMADFNNDFSIIDPFIKSKMLDKKFTLMHRDFRSFTVDELNKMDVDAVIHLAAYVSIPESMEKADEYFLNNEYGTFEFIQKLYKTKNKPGLIYASSPEVYGNPIYTPMDIDHPLYPRSIYAATKLAAEKHCRAMYEWYKYPVAIIRNFNTFGENQNVWGYSAVIPNLITQAVKGEPLTIHNDGMQTRDFQYVKDAANAYVSVLMGMDKVQGDIFNIGTGIQTPIIELAKLIKKLTKSDSEIQFVKGRSSDLISLEADYSKINEMFGWKPQYTLEDGLKKTIAWYRQFFNN